ncbi:DUF2169 family type VI secretion system accessory protein [Acidovorax sp. NCPPB 3576]|uniref:DUF2169 family type VI secretion system accessory protein n=1 Tax=Acidovorax sp. NCPPB 3576 TaxID=2940488 RepID=UPI0023495F26|nr:DUF2169 domain-containing protein [Acidovorax sp. NCPPB 3576]WCM86884.1 DUF2169 domain-containing protein [Acidovorax sp. NCPPB 3576]
MAQPSHALPSPLRSAAVPEVANHTQWPSQYFQHVDPLGDIYHVMVSRTSYSMLNLEKTDSGMVPRLLPAQEQSPLCEADQFLGEPNETSTLLESDFAPYKPKCDVLLVNATAHSPTSQPMQRWPVGFRFGDAIEKRFHVTGPRRFARSIGTLGTLQVTEPEAVKHVPLRYELAFGGPNVIRQERLLQVHADGTIGGLTDQQRMHARDAHAKLPAFFAPNPIGCGRLPNAIPDADTALDGFSAGDPARATPDVLRPAPQIEVFDHPYDGQRDYPVIGVGPVGRWWAPRVALAGTHDERWKQTRWPKSPHDHDYRYWNCAPEDQQIDYPQGGEEIVLVHFTSAARHQGPYGFLLPRQDLQLLVRLHVGVLAFAPMNIDTVILDMGTGVLSIVRRAVVSGKTGVRRLELGTWPPGTAMELDEEMMRAARAKAAERNSRGQ